MQFHIPWPHLTIAMGRMVGFVLIVQIVLLAPVFASEQGEYTRSLGEALEKANAYSFKTGGVGIIISYGSGNQGTPERIGDAFVEEIRNRGHIARYFVHQPDWPGVTLSYRIGYSSFGPWNVDEAAARIGDVIRRADAAHKVHGM